MRHLILMDFYRQNLVQGNSYTWGHFRTTGLVWRNQCMQGVTKLGPLMLCSTESTPKSAKSTNKSTSIFSARSKTILLNPRRIDPTQPSNESIFSTSLLYFGQIWSILNNYLLFYWTCAKFPAQGVNLLDFNRSETIFFFKFASSKVLSYETKLVSVSLFVGKWERNEENICFL